MHTAAFHHLRNWSCAACVSAAMLILLAGCTEEPARDYTIEGEAWKAEVAAAYDRNTQAQSRRFAGEFQLQLPPSASAVPSGAVAAALLSMAGEGLAWEGAAVRDPLRLEADVAVGGQPEGSIPLIVHENVLYISIPGLNQPEEYLSIPMEEAASTNPNLTPVHNIRKSAGLLDQVAEELVAAASPQWIRLREEASAAPPIQTEPADTTQAEGRLAAGPRTFDIEVTADNRHQLEQSFLEGWSAWSSGLPEELGIAPSFKSLEEDSFDLAVGGLISVTIDEDGYVTGQTVDLKFTDPLPGEGETSSPAVIGQLVYRMNVTDINAPMEMTKPIPTRTLPLEHVLAFLRAGPDHTQP